MIIGTGIDIVNLYQFKNSIDKFSDRFINRIFTNDEIEFCKSKENYIQLFAVRFAAKEALLKAIGTGLRSGISWHDIEILEDIAEKSLINYYGKYKKLIDNKGKIASQLSMSCTDAYAVAFAVLDQIN